MVCAGLSGGGKDSCQGTVCREDFFKLKKKVLKLSFQGESACIRDLAYIFLKILDAKSRLNQLSCLAGGFSLASIE